MLKPKKKAGSKRGAAVIAPGPRGDGVPYELLGDGIKEITQDLQEQMQMMMWTPASPFMIFQLKQMVRKLYEVHDWGGSEFMASLGISSFSDFDQINDMSALGILEMTAAALRAIPRDGAA